jgi:hypothetical protein
MSSYVADEIRAAVDLDRTQQVIRLLELAVVVERMERCLDEQVAEARDGETSLAGLIARCSR